MRVVIYLILVTSTACVGRESEHESSHRETAGIEACRQSSDCSDADDGCEIDGLNQILPVPLPGAIETLGQCTRFLNRAHFTRAVAGAACAADDECAPDEGGECINASHATSLFPGGYCTGACARDADCGEDALCGSAFSGQLLLTANCLKRCESDADCSRDGYRCRVDSLQRRSCVPGPEPLPDHVAGRACDNDEACGGAADSCKQEPSEWEAGYCSLRCLETSDCGAGAVCILPDDVFGPHIHGACYQACAQASDCRSGYTCSAWDYTSLGSPKKTSEVCVPPGAKPPSGKGQPVSGSGGL